MNFQDSIKSGFKHYVSIEGRASRSEYWFWVLFVLLLSIAASILDTASGHNNQGILTLLVSLGTLLPGICMGIRRLHDTNRSGWWLLIAFIPIVGIITLLVLYCLKGTEGSNRFGPNPLVG